MCYSLMFLLTIRNNSNYHSILKVLKLNNPIIQQAAPDIIKLIVKNRGNNKKSFKYYFILIYTTVT